MQELNQVFKPQMAAPQPTATEILEREYMTCPGTVKLVNSFREDGWTDEKILPFLESFA